jgi:hypothetical protein
VDGAVTAGAVAAAEFPAAVACEEALLCTAELPGWLLRPHAPNEKVRASNSGKPNALVNNMANMRFMVRLRSWLRKPGE